MDSHFGACFENELFVWMFVRVLVFVLVENLVYLETRHRRSLYINMENRDHAHGTAQPQYSCQKQ